MAFAQRNIAALLVSRALSESLDLWSLDSRFGPLGNRTIGRRHRWVVLRFLLRGKRLRPHRSGLHDDGRVGISGKRSRARARDGRLMEWLVKNKDRRCCGCADASANSECNKCGTNKRCGRNRIEMPTLTWLNHSARFMFARGKEDDFIV